MKTTLTIFLAVIILTVSACAPVAQAAAEPIVTPAAGEAATPLPTEIPAATSTAPAEPAALKKYENSAFGLAFQYPAAWFGPDEYISDNTLRVAVGSDTVYPYGSDRSEQIYNFNNSYYVVVQYSKNNQNDYWKGTYQTLAKLQDGESSSGERGLLIKVRSLSLGKFSGVEYIATLSESAQTEPYYSREVILVDDQSNLLTISGAPNNVEVNPGASWREVYQSIDQQNLVFFQQIVNSLEIK